MRLGVYKIGTFMSSIKNQYLVAHGVDGGI